MAYLPDDALVPQLGEGLDDACFADFKDGCELRGRLGAARVQLAIDVGDEVANSPAWRGTFWLLGDVHFALLPLNGGGNPGRAPESRQVRAALSPGCQDEAG